MKLKTERRKEPSLALGGQAVLEGVMVCSKKYMVICVMQPNNKILTKTEVIKSISEKFVILRFPLLRGIVALFETLYLGVRGLHFSASATLDQGEEIKLEEMVIALSIAVFLAISLFVVIPFFLTTFFDLKGVLFNIVEGAVRLVIFVSCLALMALFRDLKRVFQYHGAEHMAINAYESGVELNVKNAKRFSRFHPRCGTSFVLVVTLIGVLLFSILPNLGFLTRLAYRIVLIPIIGSISYEILKLSDRYKDSNFLKILVTPGLALQHLTTREPDEGMITVALKAVKEANSLMQKSQ